MLQDAQAITAVWLCCAKGVILRQKTKFLK